MPGTLNYIEGSATLDGQALGQANAGSAQLQPGQTITTADGRAEVLLTPGVFLRLGHDSAVRMISPDITDTAVAIEHGRAAVEVDQLFPQNNIHILVDKVPVQLIKTGLYEFNADNNTALVLNGEAAIDKGDRHWMKVKSGHEVNFSAGTAEVNATKFNVNEAENSGLYRWSSLRSDYLAEANQQMAPEYAGYGPGWYWDPYMVDYTFLGPYAFMSPFGWGFYPLGWGGLYGPGFYGGFYGRPGFYGRGDVPVGRGSLGAGHASGFRSGAFRSGGELGGFHGGGGFGGFHGGGGFGGHGR
ncbi:MAG TPA: hypothetical protein VHX37_16140 [Acidobacteriaceae bacterium]|nr:hypothetical protein [Acidobacteriaceae bacterium]